MVNTSAVMRKIRDLIKTDAIDILENVVLQPKIKAAGKRILESIDGVLDSVPEQPHPLMNAEWDNPAPLLGIKHSVRDCVRIHIFNNVTQMWDTQWLDRIVSARRSGSVCRISVKTNVLIVSEQTIAQYNPFAFYYIDFASPDEVFEHITYNPITTLNIDEYDLYFSRAMSSGRREDGRGAIMGIKADSGKSPKAKHSAVPLKDSVRFPVTKMVGKMMHKELSKQFGQAEK